MATAEELLAAAVQAVEDKTLVIDADLRTINIPPGVKILGVESDDDVLTLHFRMPSTYCGIDLSTFNISVNYRNAAGEPDTYPVTDAVTADGYITFSWKVGGFAAAQEGDVEFSVCLKNKDAAGETREHFNTTPAVLPVLKGLETSAAVVQKYPDVLEEILTRLENVLPRRSYVTLVADNWQLVEDKHYTQVVTVPTATANSNVEFRFSGEQLLILHDKDVAFYATNNGGVITAHALGTKPALDYTVQVRITEERFV